MKNELLLIGSVLLIYGAVLVAYRIFGKVGMYIMTVIATILANIEVLMLVDGFGMEQTLGNVMFASTYLVTDILSENKGKKSANKAVWLGVFEIFDKTASFTIYFSFEFIPYNSLINDWAHEHISAIFSTTPRLLAASFLGYIVSQRFDVWLYHKWWALTKKLTGDSKRFLWFRNNGSTLISQILNTIIFTRNR